VQKNFLGTVGITAVGMFGKGSGWGIPTAPIQSLFLTLGGIAEKPGVVDGYIAIREYLCLTVSLDHDIIDGAPAARFVTRLKDLIESGYGLDDSTEESEQAVAPGTSMKSESAPYPKEECMNTLIVYDSQYGNTKRIAQAIADALRAFGQAQAVRVDPDRSFKFQGVDLLIVGCPTQGLRPTPAMQSFLGTVSYQSLSGLAAACFDTRFRGFLWKSSAAPRMVRQLRTMGVEPIVPPESFFVKAMKKEGPLLTGEVERAATWARMLFAKVEASHPAAR